jgi:mannose-6-phosphate isomerase-like protein (cupin superfamily)
MKKESSFFQNFNSFSIGATTVHPLFETSNIEIFMLTIEEQSSGPGLHLHRIMTETFYVLLGSFQFHVNGKVAVYGPNEYCSVPPSTPHQWQTILSGPWKLLVTCSPSGDQLSYLRELARYSLMGKSWEESADVLSSSFDLEVLH